MGSGFAFSLSISRFKSKFVQFTTIYNSIDTLFEVVYSLGYGLLAAVCTVSLLINNSDLYIVSLLRLSDQKQLFEVKPQQSLINHAHEKCMAIPDFIMVFYSIGHSMPQPIIPYLKCSPSQHFFEVERGFIWPKKKQQQQQHLYMNFYHF